MPTSSNPRHVPGRVRASAAVAALAAATTLILALAAAPRATASTPPVSVFPIPGSRVATPNTQITIRGLPPSQFGSITVTGSKTGAHPGVVKADSDGQGASFIPDKPFAAAEKVTVRTDLNVVGATGGTWSFTVQTPAHPAPAKPLRIGKRAKGDVWHFRSRPDLEPASVKLVQKPAKAAAPGGVFVASQAGPVQNGVEILGPWAGLVYFKPVPRGESATDFRVQSYEGKPVLTWWQGHVSASGVGHGENEIYNSSYRPVATVRAGNGLTSDLHEFVVNPDGTALITAYQPVLWNASAIKHGSRHEIVLDAVIQEIDIKTGLVLFQWDSLDHVALGDSYSPVARRTGVPWDYFHLNSIQPQGDNSLIVSARNTSSVYKVGLQTGAVEWTLGGKRSSFKLGKGARFWYQHDVRVRPDGTITVFDDAGAPFREKQSRALRLRLDMGDMTASVVSQFDHRPPLRAAYEGNVQLLRNGDEFVGWGAQPYFTEFDGHGRQVFDARFVGGNSTYRAYRFPWTGTPATKPAIAARVSHGRTSLSASWNGTTQTSKWRILGGSSPKKLSTVATDRKTAFETTMRLPHREAYVQAQALDRHGHVLATSDVIRGS